MAEVFPLFRLRSLDLPKLGHPNGWMIQKCERDWTLRGYPRGGGHGTSLREAPKTWYEIYPLYTSNRRRHGPIHSEVLLRDARAWCNTHRLIRDRDSNTMVVLDV